MNSETLKQKIQTLDDELLNKQQGMALTGLSQAGFWNLVGKGKLNKYEIGGKVFYSRTEVVALVSARNQIKALQASLNGAPAITATTEPAKPAPKSTPTMGRAEVAAAKATK